MRVSKSCTGLSRYKSTEPEAAPPLEPDAYVPEHYAEPEMDFEMGD